MRFNWKKATFETVRMIALLMFFIGIIASVISLFRGQWMSLGISGGCILVGLYLLLGLSGSD